MSNEVNPYQPPQTPLVPTEVHVSADRPLATLGQRFSGALIDEIIKTLIYIFAGRFVVAMYFPQDAAELSKSRFELIPTMHLNHDQYLITVVICSFIIGFAFSAMNYLFLKRDGQSIGKKIVGTRIVTLDNRIPPLSASLLKRFWVMQLIFLIPYYIGIIISFVGIILIFTDEDRRCLHDFIAGTKVVKV